MLSSGSHDFEQTVGKKGEKFNQRTPNTQQQASNEVIPPSIS
jgi:hypothetical protein